MKKGALKRGQKLYLLMCEISERLLSIRRILEVEIAADDALSDRKTSWIESILECEEIISAATLTLVRLLPPKNTIKSAFLEREMRADLVDIRELLTSGSSIYSIIPEMVKPRIDKVALTMKEYAQL